MFSRDSIIVRNIKFISPKVKKIRKYTLIASAIITTGFLLFTLGYYYHLASNLPPLKSIMDYRPKTITEVYSANGRLIGEFYTERRKVVPLEKIPKRLAQAFIAAEDGRFYEHEGLDFFSIFRALIKNILVGEVVQGGSTITQQVAKSLLSSERTLKRKTREAILSYRIENKFTKDHIIFLYLNEIYLGHGAYGVQAAAENYFRKNVNELNLAEMATLAGLPQAPSTYSPFVNPELAKERMFYVLSRMVDEGFINIVEATDAMNTDITVYPITDINNSSAPYFTEHVRQYLEKTYGSRILYSEGLKVFTTLDVSMQKEAQEALKKGLFDHDRRQGFRGPVKHLEFGEMKQFIAATGNESLPRKLAQGKMYEAVVTSVNRKDKATTISLKGGIKGEIPLRDIRWARTPDPQVNYWEAYIKSPSEAFQVGDVITVKATGEKSKKGAHLFSLHQEPLAQAALLAIDPANGAIKVMEGGFDFTMNRFNRAVQARRQPGSSFKPIIYSAALDSGMTPETKIVDSPYVYVDSKRNFVWRPQNYDGRFVGPISLRKALAQSRNIISIRLAKKLGISKVIDYARKLGIRSELSRNLSISLGSSGLSLLELTSVYTVFASGGKRQEPVFIREIRDRDGKVLKNNISAYFDDNIQYETHEAKRKKNAEPEKMEETDDIPPGYTIPPKTAYTMTSLLQGVVQEGTAKKAKVLNRPVAGKTGTTDENRDAWFIGFTPDLVAGVWVGFDDRRPLGRRETGSRAALPIFIDFMKEVYKDRPVQDFPPPAKVVLSPPKPPKPAATEKKVLTPENTGVDKEKSEKTEVPEKKEETEKKEEREEKTEEKVEDSDT